MENQPFVSIILVSFNSEEYIVDCISSLSVQSYQNFNIIFVDNNSSDNSLEVVENEFQQVFTIHNNTNSGFAQACNIGIQKALEDDKTKYVVCLNLDTMVDENWLKELVSTAENNFNVGSVQSKILCFNHPDRINTAVNNLTFLGFGYCGDYLQSSSKITELQEIPYSSGSSVLFSRKALEKSGLFDKDYFLYHEDVDLGLRLQLFGYTNLLEPRSICFHKYSFTKNKKVYFLERNRLITLYKNFSTRTLWLISFAFLIKEIGLLFFLLFSGYIHSKLKGYVYIIKHFRNIHHKRKVIQKKRAISDKKIAELLVGRIEFQELNIYFLRKLANPFFDAYWKMVKQMIK